MALVLPSGLLSPGQLGSPYGLASIMSSGWGIDTTEPQEPKALAVFGDYRLVANPTQFGGDGGYRLTIGVGDKSRTLCTWSRTPSRAAIAAIIREDRLSTPRRQARDEFGALLGARFFNVTRDYRLTSPVQGTVWESSVLSAHDWNEQDVVRGVCGIHAAWPPRTLRREPLIDGTSIDGVVAMVRGLGRFVAGETGWRAERVIVDRVFLPNALYTRWRVVKRLQKLYPEVSFEEQPWTLERSLRSAR